MEEYLTCPLPLSWFDDDDEVKYRSAPIAIQPEPGSEYYPAAAFEEWDEMQTIVSEFWEKFKPEMDDEGDQFDYNKIMVPYNAALCYQECFLGACVNVARPIRHCMHRMGYNSCRIRYQHTISPYSLCKVSIAFYQVAIGLPVVSVNVETCFTECGGIRQCFERPNYDHDHDGATAAMIRKNRRILMQKMARAVCVQKSPYFILTDYIDWLFVKVVDCDPQKLELVCQVYWRRYSDTGPSVCECVAAISCIHQTPEVEPDWHEVSMKIQSAVTYAKLLNRAFHSHERTNFRQVVGYDYSPRGRRTIEHGNYFSQLCHRSGIFDYLIDDITPRTVKLYRPRPNWCSNCRVVEFSEGIQAFEKVYDPIWLPENYPYAESIAPEWYHKCREFRANKAFLSEYWAYDTLSSLQGSMIPYLYCCIATDPYGYHDTRINGILIEYLDDYITLRQWKSEMPPTTLVYKTESERWDEVKNCTGLIIRAIHKKRVAHRHISHSNFLVRASDLAVVLVDFANAVIGPKADGHLEHDWECWKQLW